MMVRNPEAVPEASAQTASDSIAGPQTSHSKLTRRGKQKRKRVDQDEVEVEAIVVAESPEGVSTVKEAANPGRRKRKKKLGGTEISDTAEAIPQEAFFNTFEEPETDKSREKKKSKGKGKQKVDVPIDPELIGGAFF